MFKMFNILFSNVDVHFPFNLGDFEGRGLVLIVSVPGPCL